MAAPESIRASRIVLRRILPQDAQALFEVVNDLEVMRYMDWAMPRDSRSIQANIETAVENWNSGSEYQWVILDGYTEAVIGSIACRPDGPVADFGYFLGRRYWGRGLAREAAIPVVAWLTAQPRITRIRASVDEDNVRSRRLLERLDFHLESVLRGATIRPNIGGSPRNTATYARAVDGNARSALPI